MGPNEHVFQNKTISSGRLSICQPSYSVALPMNQFNLVSISSESGSVSDCEKDRRKGVTLRKPDPVLFIVLAGN